MGRLAVASIRAGLMEMNLVDETLCATWPIDATGRRASSRGKTSLPLVGATMQASCDCAKILFGSAVAFRCIRHSKSDRGSADNLCLHPTGPATKTQIHLFAKWIL